MARATTAVQSNCVSRSLSLSTMVGKNSGRITSPARRAREFLLIGLGGMRSRRLRILRDFTGGSSCNSCCCLLLSMAAESFNSVDGANSRFESELVRFVVCV